MNLADARVLVTGADGFIGSHLVEALVRRGCRVRALAVYNSQNFWGWLEDLPPDIFAEVEVVTGDVRDRGSVEAITRDIEVIFHLAALIGIPYSYESPESYVATNVTGTLNVLEEARRRGDIRLLVTSTSEVYGTARYVPIDEQHPLQAQSPYSATKIAADRLAESYCRSFKAAVTIVRPFNTYGPRQSARAIVPTIITQLLAGQQEVSLGSLHPTRDMVFVRDTAEGFCRLAECDAAVGEEVNIATGVEVSMQDLAAELISQISPSASIALDGARTRPASSEVERLLGCNSKLANLTGWAPSTTVNLGLAETISWFRTEGRLSRYKPGIYNV